MSATSEHAAGDGMTAGDPQPPGGTLPPASGGSGDEPTRFDLRTWLVARAARWGVVLAVILTGVVFYALKPDVFSELDIWRGILDQSAISAIVAMGLTVALVCGDFDLSIGAMF